MSSFSGLNTSLSGLLAHKRSIDIIGHNVANVETEGYSRRRVDLSPSGILQAPGRFSTYWSNVNLGVDVVGVTRIRDEYLEAKARTELGHEAAQSRLSQIFGRVEGVFPEPSDTGIQAQLSNLWGSWADAANTPANLATRTVILEQAGQLAQTFHKSAADLTSIRRDLNSELDAMLGRVNSDAAWVAELNAQIRVATVAGTDANDIADQRDLIVDRLVRSIGATTRPAADGQIDLLLGGTALVSAGHAEQIAAVPSGPLAAPLNTLPFQKMELHWVSDGYPVSAFGGDAGAIVTGVNDVVPRYLAELDGIAASLVSTVNTLHLGGQGLDTVNDVSLNFFDPTGVTAASLTLSSDVAGQPSRLALATAGAGALDATVGHALGLLGASLAGPDALHRTLAGRLGIETRTADDRAQLQQSIAREADTERRGVSGVNLDEEMTQLIASQRAYQASARMMTTIDEMLDTLINRTGTVGR